MNGQQPDPVKAFLGVGWAFPPGLNTDRRVSLAAYEQDIEQAIRIILGTNRGERVMRPDFGCGIHELVFEAVDSRTLQRIRSEVEDALLRFEARIEVLGVTIDEDATSEGVLMIELEYRVRRTNQTGNLVFPFYFREGGRP